jgi:hypothetical protein
MKTITFPVGYRPTYLKQFLSCLENFDLSDYKIFCSAEKCPPCIKILEECKLPLTILHKPNSSGVRSHSGARDNMFNVLNYAFKSGSDFNLHLEDDFLLSPDAIDLANWYYETFKYKPITYMSYGLFNWSSKGDDFSGVTTAPAFHGLGWGAFKENWESCYGKVWYDDELARKHANAYGWDWAVQAAFKEFNYKSIIPLISRTAHVGRVDGTCCTVSFFDATYTGLVWNKTERIKEFTMRDGVETKHLYS